MAVISLINRKGGVGKSTIAINLAAGLSLHESKRANGKPILLIDMDDQLNATITAMGGALKDRYIPVVTSKINFPDMLLNGMDPFALVVESLLPVKEEQKVQIFRSNQVAFEALKRQLIQMEHVETILYEFIQPIQNSYAHIVIDSPPEMGPIPRMILGASTHGLIPIETAGLSLVGLAQLMGAIDEAREYNPDIKILGIIPSRVISKRKHTQTIIAELRKRYPDLITPELKALVEIAEAMSLGVDIYSHASYRSQAYRQFKALINTVLDRLSVM